MVTEPFIDPPRPPSEEQKRMLLEVGREYHMHKIQRIRIGDAEIRRPRRLQ